METVFNQKGESVRVFVPTKMHDQLDEIFQAFKVKDEELFKSADIEETGNPFTICTNGARWLKAQYFPTAKVVGYSTDDNPTALIGQETFGHDFILVDDRYIIDFWYRHVWGQSEAPITLDLLTQQDEVKKYYGDPEKWGELPNIEN